MIDTVELISVIQLIQCIVALNNQKIDIIRRRRALNNVILFSAGTKTEHPRAPYCHLKVNLLLHALRNEDELKAHFRVSLQAFYQLHLLISTGSNYGWDEEYQLLAFLFWLACGSAYRVVSAATGIPKSTLCDIVHRVLERVLQATKNVIKLPPPNAIPEIAEGFSKLAKSKVINKAAGSIDCTHIKIMPPDDQREDYINHKLFYSINMQAVCDHRGVFIDVFAGYPGSVHDSRVLRCSPLYRQAAYPPQDYYLLADSAYPCTATPLGILPAYKHYGNTTPVEERFNYHLSRARSVIERAFGMMKTRWRSIFTKTLEVSTTLAPKVAVACAVMHNVCVMAGDEWEEESEDTIDDSQVAPQQVVHEQVSAEPLRQQMAAEISAPVHAIQQLSEHDYISYH